ncbi:hypothetical protein [Streptosporangium carneum]|uniref:Secreted protein n=1 Tax=Streptosporangium carneum TaxID=47481 RepID=A0A9W6MH92_9ACTN|nr:hypothetical protein [Streptosporangium carneum]GLK13930.1 hypothetical protein GCM10017600_73410 [Streptosporangium carneum]
MNARRRASAACATALLTAAMVAGTASSASAAPTGCSYQVDHATSTASSYCASGTGEHRVFVLQKHFDPSVGYIPIYSEWAPAGSVSSTHITGHTIISVQVQTR